jgi:hypothetical protein
VVLSFAFVSFRARVAGDKSYRQIPAANARGVESRIGGMANKPDGERMLGSLFSRGASERWCCESLRVKFDYRSERGWFIFSEPPAPPITNQPSFWLCVRSVAATDIEHFEKTTHSSANVMVVGWQAVRFCPWCGCNLLRFYGNRFQQLYDDAVSREHGWIDRGQHSVS